MAKCGAFNYFLSFSVLFLDENIFHSEFQARNRGRIKMLSDDSPSQFNLYLQSIAQSERQSQKQWHNIECSSKVLVCTLHSIREEALQKIATTEQAFNFLVGF